MNTADVIAAGANGAPDNTVLYLLAAIIIAAMAFGYLIWRDRHRTRGRDGARAGTNRDTYDSGTYHDIDHEGDRS